tara:strand:+ start:8126 stop:9130 length:1005 start_codon:yes stop_codon:yes gene_type:complete
MDATNIDDAVIKIRKKAEEYRQLADIMDNNIGTIKRITAEMGKIKKKTVLAAEKHRHLLMRFMRTPCKKFNNLTEAVTEIGDNPGDNVLIHLTEVALYGIFTLDNYLKFVKNLSSDRVEKEDIVYKPTQVVLESWKQKIVFMCSYDTKDMVENWASKYFNSKVEVICDNLTTEITIQDKIVSGLDESTMSFRGFLNYMNKQFERDQLAKIDLKQLTILTCGNDNRSYVECNLRDHYEIESVKDLPNLFKSGPFLVINGTVNGNVNINITFNEKKFDSVEWVRSNLPGWNETKSVYYARYLEAGGKQGHAALGKYVLAEGYSSAHSGSLRYYRKK